MIVDCVECSGYRVPIPLRRERYHGLGMDSQRMLWEREGYFGLGVDAQVIACSWNTSVSKVWAWMLRVVGCFWKAKVVLLWAWILRVSDAPGTRGCSGYRMLLEHVRYQSLGIDAQLSDAFGTGT